jgi:diphthine synthase
MLYLIGIGLKPKQITLEAIDAIKSSDQVFLEGYTSEYSEGTINEIEEIIGKKIVLIGRNGVEEHFESALLSAKSNNIALLIIGNALTATTHIQLLLDSKDKEIKYKVIPGISITNTLAETGLDEYKFGRTVTICYHLENYAPETFFDQILENQKLGLHTLCLLDIKKDENPQRLMNCKEAIEILEKINKNRGLGVLFNYVGLFAMASIKQKIIFGKEKIISFKEIYEFYPQSLIILGKTNDKEKEFLEKMY